MKKKLGVWIPGTSEQEYHLKKFGVVAAQRFQVSGHLNFFSLIIINIEKRHKFQSMAYLDLSKYLYWDVIFFRQILTNVEAVGQFPISKVVIFFHGSLSLCKWGLSPRAHGIWTIRACLNWYHIGQICQKSVSVGLTQKALSVGFSNLTFSSSYMKWSLKMYVWPLSCFFFSQKFMKKTFVTK